MGCLVQLSRPIALALGGHGCKSGLPLSLPGHFPAPWSSPTRVLAAEEEEPRRQRNRS